MKPFGVSFFVGSSVGSSADFSRFLGLKWPISKAKKNPGGLDLQASGLSG
jgi:hypothetical protein